MDDLTLHRKQRLKALLDGPRFEGIQLSLAQAIGRSEGRVSQLLDPKYSFGERSAAGVSERLGLSDRYFEDGFDAKLPASKAAAPLNAVPEAQPDLAEQLMVMLSVFSQLNTFGRERVVDFAQRQLSGLATTSNAHPPSNLVARQPRGVLKDEGAISQQPISGSSAARIRRVSK